MLLIFVLLTARVSFAQVDSTYIGFFDRSVSLKGYSSRSFVFLLQNSENEEYEYMPNNPFNFGVGFSWKNTMLSFSYGYGFDFLRDRNKGKTESFDFQFHNYGRKFVFDVFIQKYKGFYLEDEKHNVELFPNLSVQQYGVYGLYVFNNKKFSYKAAFDQSQKQLKSAGSFLLGFGVYDSKIESDSSIIINDQNILRNFQFGVSAGYAYTWVLGRRWFISGSVTSGIHFGSEKFSTFGKQKLEVYPTVFPRVSVGYNREKWSLGFSYVNNIIFPSFSKDNSLGLSSGNFQLSYIWRLEDIPVLSPILSKVFK